MASTNTDRMKSLSERLRQIRQQRRALDEIASNRYSDNGSRTSVSHQSPARMSDSGRGSRLSDGWARSEPHVSTSILSSVPSADEFASGQWSVDRRSPPRSSSLPVEAEDTYATPLSEATRIDSGSGDSLSHRNGNSIEPIGEADGHDDARQSEELSSEEAEGAFQRRRLGESWYSFERHPSTENLIETITIEHRSCRPLEQRPTEQVRETPISFLRNDQCLRCGYSNPHGSGSQSYDGTAKEYDDCGDDSEGSSTYYYARERERSASRPMYYDEVITGEEEDDSESYGKEDGLHSHENGVSSAGGSDSDVTAWNGSGEEEESEYEVKYQLNRGGYDEQRPTEPEWPSGGQDFTKARAESYHRSSNGTSLLREGDSSIFDQRSNLQFRGVRGTYDTYTEERSDSGYVRHNHGVGRTSGVEGATSFGRYLNSQVTDADELYDRLSYRRAYSPVEHDEYGQLLQYPRSEGEEERESEVSVELYETVDAEYIRNRNGTESEHLSKYSYHEPGADEEEEQYSDGVSNSSRTARDAQGEGDRTPTWDDSKDGSGPVETSVNRWGTAGHNNGYSEGSRDLGESVMDEAYQNGDARQQEVSREGGKEAVDDGYGTIAQSVTGWHIRDSFDPRGNSPALRGVELPEISTREASADRASSDINPYELCTEVIRKRRQASDIRDFIAAEMWRERTELKLRMEESRRLRGLVLEELQRTSEEMNGSDSSIAAPCDPDAVTNLLGVVTEEDTSGREEVADDYVGYRTRGGVLVELDPEINNFDSPTSKRIRENLLARKRQEAEQRGSPMRIRPSSATVPSPSRLSPMRNSRTLTSSEGQSTWLSRGSKRSSSSASFERRTSSIRGTGTNLRTTNLGDNRKIVINAITWALLGGTVNKKNREAVLGAVTDEFKKLVILFKGEISGRQVYRALYGFDPDSQAFKRLHSVSSSPAFLKESYVSKAYRYTSSTRSFREIPGHRALDAATDAVCLRSQPPNSSLRPRSYL